MRYKVVAGLLIVSLTALAFSYMPDAEQRAVKEYIGYTTSELWVLLCEQAGSKGRTITTSYSAKSGAKKYRSRIITIYSKDIYSIPDDFAFAKLKKWKWNRGRYAYTAFFDSQNIVTDVKAYRLH